MNLQKKKIYEQQIHICKWSLQTFSSTSSFFPFATKAAPLFAISSHDGFLNVHTSIYFVFSVSCRVDGRWSVYLLWGSNGNNYENTLKINAEELSKDLTVQYKVFLFHFLCSSSVCCPPTLSVPPAFAPTEGTVSVFPEIGHVLLNHHSFVPTGPFAQTAHLYSPTNKTEQNKPQNSEKLTF